jgi:hypothetical protein
MVTDRIDRALRKLFATSEAATARSLIEAHFGTGFPHDAARPDERIAAAALKLSHGSISKLEAALRLSRLDWRDALMAAGFGDDVAAHDRWLDRSEAGKPTVQNLQTDGPDVRPQGQAAPKATPQQKGRPLSGTGPLVS